jgi:hypothetical protein
MPCCQWYNGHIYKPQTIQLVHAYRSVQFLHFLRCRSEEPTSSLQTWFSSMVHCSLEKLYCIYFSPLANFDNLDTLYLYTRLMMWKTVQNVNHNSTEALDDCQMLIHSTWLFFSFLIHNLRICDLIFYGWSSIVIFFRKLCTCCF